MAYRTIAQRVKEEFKNRTSRKCECGAKVTRRNLAYVINRWGELLPVCVNCAKVYREGGLAVRNV